jgi:hypothetical protein
MEMDELLGRLTAHREHLAMEHSSHESECAKEKERHRMEHAAMELNEFESTSYENVEVDAWRNEHRQMCRNAAESEYWEDTLSGNAQLRLNWENYMFAQEERLRRHNLAVLVAERWTMLRGDAEAESWRLQLSGEEQQQMTNELIEMLEAENYTRQMDQVESYYAVFGDVVDDSDAEEVVAAAPLMAPTQPKWVPKQPSHPPPPSALVKHGMPGGPNCMFIPADPPAALKHGRPGGPNCMFIPADGDVAGHALRYQKDKHNERERNRKARRAVEKACTMSKSGSLSSGSSSSTWLRPLLNPPPPPPAKRPA